MPVLERLGLDEEREIDLLGINCIEEIGVAEL
jgi:hypothetical protein